MIYCRKIFKRCPINRYGKLGFKPVLEVVKTDNIEPFNYRKHHKFFEFDKEYWRNKIIGKFPEEFENDKIIAFFLDE